MSHAARMWALSCRLSGPTKSVLLALAIRADDEEKCWPSIDTIAHDAGISERSAQGSLRELETAGLITAEGMGGRRLTRMYRLQVGVEMPPDSPRKRVQVVRKRVHVVHERVQDSVEKGAPPAPKPSSEPTIEPTIEPTAPPPAPIAAQPPALLFDADVGTVPALVNGKAAAFAEFWELYPHRLSAGRMVKPDKAQAERAFATAIKRVPPEIIVEAVRNFPFQRDKPQYIPGPAVWLNKGNYLAEVAPSTASTGDDMEAARRDWGIGGIAELEELHRQKEIEDGN